MTVEAIDDLALLSATFNQYRLSELFDEHLPDHGNWTGISGGKVVCGWLLYMLSQADHRLSHVQDWAARRIGVLAALLNEPEVCELDFSDDRLGRLLDRMSHNDGWASFEQALGQVFIEVYTHLGLCQPDAMSIIRCDSFNAPQFRKPGLLFGMGYTKHRRNDQAQCKVMVAALDPWALPLAVDVVRGSGPDYEHYLPLIERARQTISGRGTLYVGDSQWSSAANRLAIHQAGDYYLSPLNLKQCGAELRRHYLDQLPVDIDELPGIDPPDSPQQRARYYELNHAMSHDGVAWTERRILCYSAAYADKHITAFDKRLAAAETKLRALTVYKRGRKNPKTLAELHRRIGLILGEAQLADCFTIDTQQTITYRQVQKWKDRPARTVEQVSLSLDLVRNEDVIAAQRQRKGWQLYATNVGEHVLGPAELIGQYRNEYRIEHLFDYAINRDMDLLPLYLHHEHRVKGLIKLIFVGMRFSSSIQTRARQELQRQAGQLDGVYAGNKGRKTARPTTPMLLRQLRGIAMVFMETAGQQQVQLSELNHTQCRILELLHLPNIYQELLQTLNAQTHLCKT
jgi:transposase